MSGNHLGRITGVSHINEEERFDSQQCLLTGGGGGAKGSTKGTVAAAIAFVPIESCTASLTLKLVDSVLSCMSLVLTELLPQGWGPELGPRESASVSDRIHVQAPQEEHLRFQKPSVPLKHNPC